MKISKIHYSLLKEGLNILNKLLDSKYNKYKSFVFFSGGTSLMFKYKDFYRFSIDLDFAISVKGKKYNKIFYNLFIDLKGDLEKFCYKNEIPIFTTFGNWREFVFQSENGVSSLKIDFMYDYILDYELCCDIFKVSDKDIFINKLQRLNQTDISDLKFLIKKNDFSIGDIISGIIEKSKYLYGDEYYLTYKIYTLLKSKKYKNFKFLDILKNELGNI